MNYGIKDLTSDLDALPARYARTPFAVFDMRTKVVKDLFVTAEAAGDFALMCQQVDEEKAREVEVLKFVFGEGAAA